MNAGALTKRDSLRASPGFFLAVLLLFGLTGCEPPIKPKLDTAQPAGLAPRPGMSFRRDEAFKHLRRLTELGPRPTGSRALQQARDYIVAVLDSAGASISLDVFDAHFQSGTATGINVIGSFPGKSERSLVLAAHYDTKKLPGFVGANDGASAAALLLELAHHLEPQRDDLGVHLVFFDAEESENAWDPPHDGLVGSSHLVEKWKKDKRLAAVAAVVVVDMIADVHLGLRKDTGSTGWLYRLFEKKAEGLGYNGLFTGRESGIEDDHTPFLDAGIPAADLIDFDFGPGNTFWHTDRDSLENVDAASLAIVGDLLLESIPDLNRKLR